MALFFGQRMAKDYAGAAVLVPYFLLTLVAIYLLPTVIGATPPCGLVWIREVATRALRRQTGNLAEKKSWCGYLCRARLTERHSHQCGSRMTLSRHSVLTNLLASLRSEQSQFLTPVRLCGDFN